jgi:hypothetical protein
MREKLNDNGGITTRFEVEGDSEDLLKGVVVMAFSHKPALWYKMDGTIRVRTKKKRVG